MAVAQKPTKQDLKERLKLSGAKNEAGETKGSIRNFSGIISNDVSADNLIKIHPGNESESSRDKPESLVDNQSNKTNGQQVLSKSNVTANSDETSSKLSSNSTAGKNNSSAEKAMDQESSNKSVNNSTKETSGLKWADQLRDANVTEDVHVANITQKPKIELHNKQLLQNDKENVEGLVANNLKNSSKPAANANKEKQVAIQKQANPDAESSDTAAEETAQALGHRNASAAAKTNPLNMGDMFALQKTQKGFQSAFAPKPATNANLKTHPKQFSMHLEFPNVKQFPDGTFADGKKPKTSVNKLAQITAQATAAALGLIHNTMENRQPQQQAPAYTNVGADFPFKQNNNNNTFNL